MTPEQHNKYLGLAHLAHGGLFLLMVVAILGMMSAMFLLAPSGPGNPPPPAAIIGVMWVFMGAFYGLMLLPSFIAGYALLKRKRWAKVAAIIGGVTAAMSFPIGTAVCAYTFWFLFSEPGKFLYDRPLSALPPATGQPQRELQYVPPTTPPDWR